MSSSEREGYVPEMSIVRTAAIERMLLDTIREEPAVRRRKLRNRVIALGGAGVLAIAAATTGASIVLQEKPVTNLSVAHCFAAADPQLIRSVTAADATLASDTSTSSQASNAIALCKNAWQNRAFDSGDYGQPAAHEPGQAPSLAVCVMPDGTAAVIPAKDDNICVTVGLAPLGN